MPFTSQTRCKNGHEFTEENTYISPKSQKRTCRICNSARVKEHRKDPKVREHLKIAMRKWRTDNPERNKQNWTDLRRSKKEWLDSIRSAGCIRCEEKDPSCIDLHHRDPEHKKANVSVAIAHWSLARLKEEIAKCDLICANCHRKLHAQERDRVAISNS